MSSGSVGKISHFDRIDWIMRTCDAEKGMNSNLCPVNLSRRQEKKYVTVLVEYGLLEPTGNGFRTTAKGRVFMKRFEELLERLDEGSIDVPARESL